MSDRHHVMPYPFRMESDVKKGLEELAKQEERSRNWLLNRLVRMALPIWNAKRKGEVNYE